MAEMTVGMMIRQRRREVGLTQAELGKMIGVENSYIAKIENEKQRGSYETLARISLALKLPWSEMYKLAGFEPGYLENPESMFHYVDVDGKFTEIHPKLKILLLDLVPVLERHLGIAH